MVGTKDQLPAGTTNCFCSSGEEALAGKWGNKWKVVDDLLTISCRVYVPASSAHVQALLEADIGHEGTKKTLHHLQVDFHIPSAQTVW
jgi:hypothetical protein